MKVKITHIVPVLKPITVVTKCHSTLVLVLGELPPGQFTAGEFKVGVRVSPYPHLQP